jgi:sensor histidine kinase regulating citrate/malate metabolism
MISFVVIITITNFCVSYLLSDYIEGDLMDATGRDASSIKIIAEQRYPNGELARMIEARDGRLNDLADEVFVKTGIRPNIFLGNERVAAAPSALGTGRMLGARVESRAVDEAIFQNGEKYVGKVVKAGHVGIASYEPIYSGDKVVGMIGTGKYLDKMYEAQTKLFNLFTVASSVFLTLMVGIMIYAGSGKKKA